MTEDNSMLYCIIVKRELEDDYVFHYYFTHEPTKEDILDKIQKENIGYDDRYGKFEYYPIK